MKNSIKYISIIAMSVHAASVFSLDLGKFNHLSNKYRLSYFDRKKNQNINKQSIDYAEISKAIALGAIIVGSVYLGNKHIKALSDQHAVRLFDIDRAIQAFVISRTVDRTRLNNL